MVLPSSSGCCRPLGESESGAGKAAIDQITAEMNVAQAAVKGALKVVVVGEGDIGEWAAP
ncbi:hypothetical protein SGFS_098160 [Streptomyces graminofaciens]|uniref:Uncharacterized protein n=1 Tax=Streptomyces graminofaciens TaxID=68212 RepID=A0ABN5W4E6_9ACTN|nr:hypothetical protein SGFS_098160 [Streptomyces graminofaciens]